MVKSLHSVHCTDTYLWLAETEKIVLMCKSYFLHISRLITTKQKWLQLTINKSSEALIEWKYVFLTLMHIYIYIMYYREKI